MPYQSRVVCAYAWVRFQAGSWAGGSASSVCQTRPGLQLQGYDLDAGRIEEARLAADRLSVANSFITFRRRRSDL